MVSEIDANRRWLYNWAQQMDGVEAADAGACVVCLQLDFPEQFALRPVAQTTGAVVESSGSGRPGPFMPEAGDKKPKYRAL